MGVDESQTPEFSAYRVNTEKDSNLERYYFEVYVPKASTFPVLQSEAIYLSSVAAAQAAHRLFENIDTCTAEPTDIKLQLLEFYMVGLGHAPLGVKELNCARKLLHCGMSIERTAVQCLEF